MKCFASLTMLFSGFASLAIVFSLVTAASAAGDASKKETLTYTATTTKVVIPTVTSPGGQTVTYVGGSSASTSYTYASSITGTFTHTYTQTSTSYTHLKAAHTVSVPTSKGFTPLLSESEYTDSIKVVKKTETTTPYSYTYYPSPTSTYTKTQGVVYVTTGTSKVDTTVYATSNPTITSTIPAVATTTIYAACASSNIATKIPTGQNLMAESFTYTNSNTTYGVYNTPEDCCASCMAAGGCAGGSFAINGGVPYCTSYTLNPQNTSQTCDGSKDYSTFSYGEPDSAISLAAVFNGPCGGLDWVFDSRAYFQ